MRTDIFTKVLLAVIAVSLAVIAVRLCDPVSSATAGAEAAGSPYDMKVNYDGSINVRLVEMPEVRRAVPVEIKAPYSGIPVEIKNNRVKIEVDRALDVNVKNNYISTKPY